MGWERKRTDKNERKFSESVCARERKRFKVETIQFCMLSWGSPQWLFLHEDLLLGFACSTTQEEKNSRMKERRVFPVFSCSEVQFRNFFRFLTYAALDPPMLKNVGICSSRTRHLSMYIWKKLRKMVSVCISKVSPILRLYPWQNFLPFVINKRERNASLFLSLFSHLMFCVIHFTKISCE